MGAKEVTTILEVVNARHGPEANMGEAWPMAGWHDHLGDPASLVAYLDYEGLDHPAGQPTEAELRDLRDLAHAARAGSAAAPDPVALHVPPEARRLPGAHDDGLDGLRCGGRPRARRAGRSA